MKNNNNYFLYVRKSSEWNERQAQSIDDQITTMKKKANILGINIIETFNESKSAKTPWREQFNLMIGKIYEWKANWIISWKLDRLTRNPVDTGTIQMMLQNWTLKKIITNDRDYDIENAWLIMSVETWMANQYILDLTKNVVRWMEYKTSKWWFCWKAPEWYLNHIETKSIIVDKINFPLIRKAWDLMLTWNYTVPQVMNIMNNDWWYTKNKKTSNPKITKTGIYSMFKNPFYTWHFLWKWKLNKWKHKAMISFEEFDIVQDIIWEKWNKIRPRKLEFSYTWMVKCWECGWTIVWTQKTKNIASSWEPKNYIYYHCSKRQKGCNCKQKPVNLNTIEKQIDELLENIEIIPDFKNLAVEILKRDYKSDIEEKEKIRDSLNKSLKKSEQKLDRMINLLLDWKISDEIYETKKEEVQNEINNYRWKLSDFNIDKDMSLEETEKAFNFIAKAREHFNKWSKQDKKLILSNLGENFTLINWELWLTPHSWLIPIQKLLPEIKKEYEAWEILKKGTSFSETNTNSHLSSLWRCQAGSNRCIRCCRPLYNHSTMAPLI